MSPILDSIGSVKSYGWGAIPLPPGAYEPIASATGTGSSNTITFSSIPSTYTSLQVRITVRNTNATTGVDGLLVRFNNDSTSSGYEGHSLTVTDPGLAAQAFLSQNHITIQCVPNANNAANIVGAAIIDLHDYTSTTRKKTLRAFSGCNLNGSGTSYLSLSSGLWKNTAAITRIDFVANTGFSTQTQIALYGIKGE